MKFLDLTQQEALDILLKPMVKASATFGEQDAPICLKYNVKDGSYLSKVSMPDFAFQTAPSVSTIIANNFQAKNNPTGSKAQWGLVDYDLFSFIARSLLGDLDVHDDSAQGLSVLGQQVLNSIASLYQPLLDTDIKRMAFWSDSAFDPDTTHASKHDFPAASVTLMQGNSGFVKLIKAAITANDVENVATTNGAAISKADAYTLLNNVYNNCLFIMRQKAQADIPQEQKPVILVSDQLYTAYGEYLADLNSPLGYAFYGYTESGMPDQNRVIGYKFKGCLVINASDIFDNHAYHLHNQDLGTTASANAAKYTHYAIMTDRDNLQIAYNFQPGLSGLVVEGGEISNKFGLKVGLFPKMDFQIAEATSKAISVAGFQ